MIPTERGKELYCHVVQALEKLERVSEVFSHIDPSLPPLLRLGMPLEYFYEVVLPRLKGLPLRLWVRFGLTQQLLEELEQDELDLVIATQRLPARDVEYQCLEEERFLLVSSPAICPPPETAASLPRLKEWLATQCWISYGVEWPIIRRFWRQHFDERLNFQPTFVVPNLHAIERAIELGYGISILPEYLCRAAIDAGRLRILYEAPESTVNELWLAYRKVGQYKSEIKLVQEALQPAQKRVIGG
jgi:DNA-binding transcriptional LysR family regulator